MINPIFNQTITLYHQSKDVSSVKTITVWTRTVHTECYYGTQKAENLSGNTLSQASSYIVRIPYNGTKIDVCEGDVIVCGSVSDEITDMQGSRMTDLLKKYKPDCFTVRTCSDNTKIAHGAHYKLTGV